MPTFNGTSGNDTMDYRTYSTAPPAGWPEHQAWLQLNGLGGNDTIRGSTYNDAIDGGEGNDTLYGYNGKDSLTGGNGADIMYGGDGDDFLSGGAGIDQLYGEAGNDWLNGGNDNDYMSGGSGNDTFVGGSGADQMLGGTGDDIFFGDAGNDIVKGEDGNDRLWAGSGNDQYYFNGDGFDFVNDGVTNTGSARTDTTYDTSDVLHVSYISSDILFLQDGNDLYITSDAEYMADGIIDDAVIIEDFFLGGHYVVETLRTSNSMSYDLTSFLIA